MSQEQRLTPAQQALMDFLDKLATTPHSPALMDEGYQALDDAVEENRRLQDSITDASKTLYSARKESEQA